MVTQFFDIFKWFVITPLTKTQKHGRTSCCVVQNGEPIFGYFKLFYLIFVLEVALRHGRIHVRTI